MLTRKSCAVYGFAGVLLALLGQFLTVYYNDGGDWSALFYTGKQTTIPESLGETVYRAPDTAGFDGQFYHLIAHDPFLSKGYAASVDNPRLRWRRILVPALSFALAMGESRWVDTAFFAVLFCFVFLGVYWLARIALELDLHPAFGLLFLALPAVYMALERMTVDLALAALAVGFALYIREPNWKLFAVMVAAPLARETGVPFLVGYCAYELLRRNFARMAIYSCSAIPFLAWTEFVHSRTASDATAWGVTLPFGGLVLRTLNPLPFEITGLWVGAAAIGDYLGILGIWVSIAAVVYLLWKKQFDPLTLGGCAFVFLAAFLGKEDVWRQSYGFSRIFSPWFVWLAVTGWSGLGWVTAASLTAHESPRSHAPQSKASNSRAMWMLLPWALSIPRVAIQSWMHIPGIIAGLLGRRI